jgi:DNA-directed RNA polymerase specialized sigma24 family protein
MVIPMQLMQEAINTFDNWITPKRQATAMSTYDEISRTQKGQKQILGAAASGDHVAADYLFLRLKGVIAKAFWKYFMGPDKGFHRAKIMQGSDKDFASIAYEMLLGSGKTSPYATFKFSGFSSSADLIKQFGYYFYRYMQNEAFKNLRADKLGGLAGNIKTGEDVHTVGYEDHFENDENAASTDDYTAETNTQMAFEALLQKLKKENLTYYRVLVLKAKGFDVEAIAKKLDISGQSVRNHLKAIKPMVEEYLLGA